MRLRNGIMFGVILGVLFYRVGAHSCPESWFLLGALAVLQLVGSSRS